MFVVIGAEMPQVGGKTRKSRYAAEIPSPHPNAPVQQGQ
jgi:hypothetical protein